MTLPSERTVYDSKGQPLQAYLHQLSNGDYLQIDKVLADTIGAEEFCRAEIDNAEGAIQRKEWT